LVPLVSIPSVGFVATPFSYNENNKLCRS